MHGNQPINNHLLNLPNTLTWLLSVVCESEPLLTEFARAARRRDKHNFKFASVKGVTDDDLVSISFERSACLWDQEVLVRLQLSLTGKGYDCTRSKT